MSDAERNVTIRLNIVAGDMQKPDVSWLTTAGKEAVALIPELKSIADVTKEIVDANKSLVEVMKEVEKNSKLKKGVENESSETSRKASRERIQIAKDEQKEITKIRQSSTNSTAGGGGKKTGKTEPSGNGGTTGTESSDAGVAAADKSNGEIAENIYKWDKKLIAHRVAMNAQHDREIKEQADKVMKTTQSLMKQRIAEEKKFEKQEEMSAKRVEKQAEMAAKKLPMLYKKIEHGIMGAAVASAKFGMNLTLLNQTSGKDTEELAKKFVEVQAKIGMVTEAYSTVKSAGGTLKAMQTAGMLTEKMIKSQQALGVATTFSQTATIELKYHPPY